MGFCLFNHIAIAAVYAQEKYGVERVAILDFDVHHGNGTQEAFWASPSVFFHSIHQLPLYPHTGEAFETGIGAGQGLTLNTPVVEGATLVDYERAWQEDLAPALARFEPQFILVSAGFDAHHRDPLAGIELETADFATLTQYIVRWADQYADGRLVSLLEGGYDRQALGEGAVAHVRALAEA